MRTRRVRMERTRPCQAHAPTPVCHNRAFVESTNHVTDSTRRSGIRDESGPRGYILTATIEMTGRIKEGTVAYRLKGTRMYEKVLIENSHQQARFPEFYHSIFDNCKCNQSIGTLPSLIRPSAQVIHGYGTQDLEPGLRLCS